MNLFSELALIEKKHTQMRELPQVLDTGWRPPSEFPNLSAATALAFDVETYDPDLTDHGPGWARGRGHIVGFSIAARDRSNNRGKWYFPIRHEVGTEHNLDPAQCLNWLRFALSNELPKVGANLIYDIGWLGEENIKVNGPLYDVQFAEALLDEQGRTSLDYLARKYLGQTKTTDELYAWLARAYGGKPTGAQRANLYRTPPILAGPYGEDDAALPLDILSAQWPLLAGEGLLELFDMECGLIPLLVAMRREGVSVDLDEAEKLRAEFQGEIIRLNGDLADMVGFNANVASPKDLVRVFDACGVQYNINAETEKASFTKEILAGIAHPVGKLINGIREYEKLKSTFVEGYILNGHVGGKLYCTFHPLRSDEGGAKTGRFSSSDPNLQNIPARSKVGKRIRKCFIPDRGHDHFRKFDYSQIEYRMLAHFAVGEGADELRATYNRDPKTDYHNQVMIAFAKETGRDLSIMSQEERDLFRKPIKNVNFGLLYGQTEKALAHKSGMTPEQAHNFFKSYHQTASYVKPTMDHIGEEVQAFGYVRTVLGRRTRFHLWEPLFGRRAPGLPYDAALRTYGANIRRAYAYRGVNYKLQGSAAEVLKRAMLAAYRSGVFDATGIPRLTVHDELDFSVAEDTPQTREAFAYLTHLLENSTQLNVPVIVDTGTGANWGAIA